LMFILCKKMIFGMTCRCLCDAFHFLFSPSPHFNFSGFQFCSVHS
jgi:hypothetical protein